MNRRRNHTHPEIYNPPSPTTQTHIKGWGEKNLGLNGLIIILLYVKQQAMVVASSQAPSPPSSQGLLNLCNSETPSISHLTGEVDMTGLELTLHNSDVIDIKLERNYVLITFNSLSSEMILTINNPQLQS